LICGVLLLSSASKQQHSADQQTDAPEVSEVSDAPEVSDALNALNALDALDVAAFPSGEVEAASVPRLRGCQGAVGRHAETR
jgi:hypothetical protein